MSILDSLTSCIWFNPEYQRNTLSSMLAGVLFFTGWWFMIDAMAVHSGSIFASYIILGILGTASLIMVNSVTQAQINGDAAFSGGCLEARGARVWIFVGFVLGFAAIIAAVWMMIVTFNEAKEGNKWPPVALLLQNVFIFLSSLVYKFGRSEESWN